MFNRTSELIVGKLVENGTIASVEKEIYLFGVQQGLAVLLNIGTTIFIGLMFGVLWQMLIFTIAYILLRSFAGGYHAKTPIRCFFLSVLLIIVSSSIIKYVVLHEIVHIALIVITSVFITILSPVGNQNKPLDKLEKKVYKKRAVVICFAQVFIAVVSLFLGLNTVFFCLTWSLVMVCAMILIEKINAFIQYKLRQHTF